MTRKILLGAASAALIIWAWGFLTWVLLNWRTGPIQRFTNEDSTGAAIAAATPKDGLYMYPHGIALPGEDASAKEAEAMKKMEKGPYVFAVVVHGGTAEMGLPMVMHLVTQALAGGLVVWLLLQTTGLGYWKRWLFVTLFGLAAGIACYSPESVWWHFPVHWTAGGIVETTVGWALAGLAIARIAR